MKVKKGKVIKDVEESIVGDYIAAGWTEYKEIFTEKKEDK